VLAGAILLVSVIRFLSISPDADRFARAWDFLEHNLISVIIVSHIPPSVPVPFNNFTTRHRNCTSLLNSVAAVSTFSFVLVFPVHLVFSRRIQANLQFLILGCKIACLFKSSLTMSQELSYSDVSSHSSKKDLYVVIHDKVYNASSFIDEHP
jgi:hypothetical protein